MRRFNSIEEIKKYYNKNTNTYEFIEDGILLGVEFTFDLKINGNINARDINALDINAHDINALNINARDIKAWDINARGIKAWDINASGIKAWDINALDINAHDINARDIKALDITYYAVCFAYRNIECSSIKGRRANAKHFVSDGEIKIIEKDKELEKEKENEKSD